MTTLLATVNAPSPCTQGEASGISDCPRAGKGRAELSALNHRISARRSLIKRCDEILAAPCPRRLADEISRRQSHHMLALALLLQQRQDLLDTLDRELDRWLADDDRQDQPPDLDPERDRDQERDIKARFAQRLAEDATEPGRDYME